MRGRFASGILRQAGLDEWVASDQLGYVERVERLCADARLRDTVRGDFARQRGPLFHDRAIVKAFAERLGGLVGG
jgi:predicted O-linked N-acetylglucosamine transferase (SPINDLY family)